MEGLPQPAQSGELPDRQLFDPRVLDKRDQHDLQGLEASDREMLRGEDDMSRRMRDR